MSTRHIHGCGSRSKHHNVSGLRAARGQVLPIMALFLVVMLGASALAIDLGYAYVQQRHVQNMADSAAAAGAIVLLKNNPNATDAQVQQAINNNLSSNGAQVTWDVPGVATPNAGIATKIRAEYAYYDNTAQQLWLSGAWVGRSAGAPTPVPTMVISGTPVVPNAIKVDRMSANVPAFFGAVLGYHSYKVAASGAEALRPPPLYNMAVPTGTPGPSTVNTAMCLVPITVTSPLTPSYGYYYTFSTQASGDITATWAISTPSSSSGSFSIGLYLGTPLGSPSGVSQWDPNSTGQLLTSPPKMEATSEPASNGEIEPQSLDYTANTGAISATGPATYTIYFYNGNNKYDPVYSASVSYMSSSCAPPPFAPGIPPGTFVPFSLWDSPTGRLTLGSTYTFWGAQWDSQVTGSNYDSTARMKGYLDNLPTNFNPSSPAVLPCPPGSTNTADCYSTHPGDASSPPGSPGYTGPSVLTAQGCLDSPIDVPVIDTASRSGNMDYGQIVAIVELVVTNPCAYKPDPGHPMTGTIVAAPWDPTHVVGPAVPSINQVPGG